MYDVVVVGAGPAGSMAAKVAAENGLKVLLIEKRQEIGTPVRCAEGVSKRSLQRFVEIDKKWIANEVVGAKIYSPDMTEIVLSEEMAGNEVGYVLERKIFDRYLARLAAKSGAEVYTKTTFVEFRRVDGKLKVKLRKLGEIWEVETNILIGADGVESRVGRLAGIIRTLKLNEIESCAQYLMVGLNLDPNYTYFYLGKDIAPGGYAWIFPKGENSANVGVGVLPSMAEKPAKYYLDKFIEKVGIEGKIIEFVAGAVPVYGEIDTAVCNNIMLAGDAAYHSDPITGGGIANALAAGYYAGKVAFDAVKAKDFSEKILKRYDELWKNDFGKKLRRNKKLQEKFLKMDDETLNKLAKSISGKNLKDMSVLAIVIELVKANPKLLFEFKDLLIQ
ncbi:MAG: NAD(P)/FAD-dependent oxidoreductase [Archaeoglobaceae archaeon]|nr:NAD(P)/FAD-dependent oxidoreductase [Archaeoglobaceae archaeon]MCX8151986.1 NAD(P)/FAD-dependent oxidoreductase [Archaeoglobaceae archaeon]MDW8013375.1 NAD(P)/FAD-dependent oxidoreductase [Archaeoglobaceae archaeon]